MKFNLLLQLSAANAVTGATTASGAKLDKLPVVDLKYARHQASYNSQHDLFSFKNIRYADPPLGEKRFKHAVPPSTVNRTINDGSHGNACRNGYPQNVVVELMRDGETEIEARERLTRNPIFNEDCLFLDVILPKKVFEKTKKTRKPGSHCPPKHGAPVIVWIHGGAYTMGYKDEKEVTPSGLIERSKADGSDGVVFVSLNYRLGMFGFLNVEGDDQVEPNAGLHDQRLALEWVRDHISLFGGDPDNVTVIGESAGAGSIVYHITGDGGKTKAPFNKAIAQSIAYGYIGTKSQWDLTLKKASTLSKRTIKNGAELAELDDEVLMNVYAQVTYDAPLSLIYWGPSPDGDYVPAYPDTLLSEGRFDKTQKLLISHTANETISYIPNGTFQDKESWRMVAQLAKGVYPSDEVMDYIFDKLYPPVGETDLYYSKHGRTLLMSAEALGFNCHDRTLARAYGNATWNFRFEVPPAWHAQDVNHTFYDGNKEEPFDADAAIAMQTYFTSFARSGNPNRKGDGLPEWPMLVDGNRRASMVEGGVEIHQIEDNAERCFFWERLWKGDFADGPPS